MTSIDGFVEGSALGTLLGRVLAAAADLGRRAGNVKCVQAVGSLPGGDQAAEDDEAGAEDRGRCQIFTKKGETPNRRPQKGGILKLRQPRHG